MFKLKDFRFIGKIALCGVCGTVQSKSKHISTESDPSKKLIEVGEQLIVDITGSFPLMTKKWHKCAQHKLFWCGLLDKF